MPEVEARAPVAPVGSADLTYITGHTRSTVRGQRPRLAIVKQNHKNGLPVCTVAPAVTGTVTVGQVQTCTSGTWLNSPAYTYQWRRAGVANIPSATAATYTLVTADKGYVVECEVTATNGAGVVVAKSNGSLVP
jgi:hypothetical protein